MSVKTKKLTAAILRDNYMPEVMVFRGACANLDTCVDWGIYQTTSSTVCALPPLEAPIYWKYGIVEVMRRGNRVYQRLSTNEGMFYRSWLEEATPGPFTAMCLTQ